MAVFKQSLLFSKGSELSEISGKYLSGSHDESWSNCPNAEKQNGSELLSSHLERGPVDHHS